MVVNYDLIVRGKYIHKNTKMVCPNIKFSKEKKHKYEWKVDSNVIFIFDEVHRCSNLESENCKLLLSAKNTGCKLLMLSATIADFPEKFKPFFYILNFIKQEQIRDQNISIEKYMRIVDEWIWRDKRPMVRIHIMLYPDRASRMRIDVLGDMFPETQITATPYNLDESRRKKIEQEYKILSDILQEIKDKKSIDKKNPLVYIMRAQQNIEALKIPLFVELANDYIHNGYSVVIFVNFTNTLEKLCEMLHTENKIYGEQTIDERNKIIDEFQSNRSKIIICNIKAGGIGISLHDIYGNHPRVSLISPTWSSIDLIQALGRIHRAGGKSKSLQRIIYAAETVEDRIADKIKSKLANINSINNGDLDLTNIDFQTERIK